MNDDSEVQDFHNHLLRIAEDILYLVKKKYEIEGRFLNQNFPIIITSIISVAAILVTITQIYLHHKRMDEQLEIKAISFITDQIGPKADVHSFNAQLQYIKSVIKAALPDHNANKIISRIDNSALFLHQLEGWSIYREGYNKRPAVLLLDTNLTRNVYSPFQQNKGGTNADDIFEVLSNLPVLLIRDVIKANWKNEFLIWKLRPELIVVHRDCFEYDESVGEQKKEEDFINFVKKINKFLPETKWIIYSRVNPEEIVNKIFNQIKKEKKQNQIEEEKDEHLKVILKSYELNGLLHFRDLINAEGLRQEVIEILKTNEHDCSQVMNNKLSQHSNCPTRNYLYPR